MPRPRTEDYIPVGDDDHDGFTVDDRFKRKFERQREKVERLEEQFLEEMKRELRKNRAQIAREFIDYANQNPSGQRVRIETVWGGEATGNDYERPRPNLEPDEDY